MFMFRGVVSTALFRLSSLADYHVLYFFLPFNMSGCLSVMLGIYVSVPVYSSVSEDSQYTCETEESRAETMPAPCGGVEVGEACSPS